VWTTRRRTPPGTQARRGSTLELPIDGGQIRLSGKGQLAQLVEEAAQALVLDALLGQSLLDRPAGQRHDLRQQVDQRIGAGR
jgi:hypothetical protein